MAQMEPNARILIFLMLFQPWIFIGTIDTDAEAPILWPLDMKSRLTGKDPDTGKDWML